MDLFNLQNLSKRYGAFEALKDITLELPEGSVGLLGPNGAGKSTLIKTLLGLLDFSQGSATVLGHKLPEDKTKLLQSVGYMPENDSYLPYMSAINYVSFGGLLTGMPRAQAFRRAHEVLHYVGLGEARYRTLDGFSTGMKQRVKLAQALVHGPKLIFLDEPTNGLDPKGRDEMLDLIQDVKARGVNVVLSTHLLSDVERVCESIIVMNQGALLYSGSLKGIMGGDQPQTVEVSTKNQNDALHTLLDDAGMKVSRSGQRLSIVLGTGHTPQDILKLAYNADIQVRHFIPGHINLETAFLDIIEQQASSTT